MKTTLSQFLRQKRLDAGLSQSELAERVLGKATYQPYIASWESGRHIPTALNLLRLSDALGLSLPDYTDVDREAKK